MTREQLQARIRAILAEWRERLDADPQYPVSHVVSEPVSAEDARAAIEAELTEGGRWERLW